MFRGYTQFKYISCFILFYGCLSQAFAMNLADRPMAEGMVTRFYGFVFFKGQSPDFKDLNQVKHYFEPNFYNDLITLMKISGKNEIVEHQLEFSPFTNAQDNADGFMLTNIKDVKADNNTIQMPIVFLLRNNEPQSKNKPNGINQAWGVTVSLIKNEDNSEWKINDIIYPNENKRLSKLAKEATQYIKDHHIKEDPDGYYRW